MNKKVIAIEENEVKSSVIFGVIVASTPVIIMAFIPVLWIRLILALIYVTLLSLCGWYTWYGYAKVVTPESCNNEKIFGTKPLNCQRNYSPEYGEDLDFPNSK